MKRLLTICLVSLVLLASLLSFGTVQATSVPLYAGTSGVGEGKVYSYQGGCISNSIGYVVLDIIEYNGQLFASTMSTSDPMSGVGKVWRYQGGTSWTTVGNDIDNQVGDLVEWNGALYAGAGTAGSGGKLYRYNGSNNFDYVGSVANFNGIRSMYASSYGYLQLGDMGYDKFGRFDGTNFHFDTYIGGSCIYDYAEFNGALYAAAYEGRLHKSIDGINWSTVLSSYDGHMWELEPFQGKLYMGYDNGELAYLDTSGNRHSVWTAPDGIISMVADGDSTLYLGIGGEAGSYFGSSTSGTGYVYAYTGVGTPTLVSGFSGPMGVGVQCLYTPEPATICLLGLGGLALLRTRASQSSKRRA